MECWLADLYFPSFVSLSLFGDVFGWKFGRVKVLSIVDGLALQQYAYLVTKSSDEIFFCRPISILGHEIFYLSQNINLRPRNLYFVATL
jgi:hypothetical protein